MASFVYAVRVRTATAAPNLDTHWNGIVRSLLFSHLSDHPMTATSLFCQRYVRGSLPLIVYGEKSLLYLALCHIMA